MFKRTRNMWTGAAITVAFLVGYVLSGHSPLARSSTNTIVEIGGNKVLVQDASQRNVIVAPGPMGEMRCSEPPPDAIGTFAEAISASFKGVDGTGADAARELKTAVDKLFQRSQGIQAMRDVLFRLCEATQNGVLNPYDYIRLITATMASLNFVVPFEYCSTAAAAMGAAGSMAIEASKSCYESVITYNAQLMEAGTRAGYTKFGQPRVVTDDTETESAPIGEVTDE